MIMMLVCGLTLSRISSVRVEARPDDGPAERREGELEQQADEEDRCGVDEDREQAQDRVGQPVAVARGEPAERDADANATISAQNDSSRVAAPYSVRMLGDGAVVGEGRAEVAVEEPADVLPVLGQDRPVEAGGVLALGDLRGVSRPPSAAVIGSPMTRIRRNTIVTRIHSIGMISGKRTRR